LQIKAAVIRIICFASVILITSLSCGKGKKTASLTSEDSDQNAEQETVVQPVQAVCILDELAFWSSPSTKKGYKNYNLKKGEIVTWLGTQETEQDDDRKRKFYGISLSDGSEGWALAAYIVPDAEPAVVVDKTSIYSKNSLISKTDSSFEALDIIALVEIQDEWLKVVGRFKENPVWIKPGKTTRAEVDIAVANQASRALAEKDRETLKEKLTGILEEEAFTDSIFIPLIQAHLQELLDEERTEEQAFDESDRTAEDFLSEHGQTGRTNDMETKPE
jgi:hypothetical protein